MAKPHDQGATTTDARQLFEKCRAVCDELADQETHDDEARVHLRRAANSLTRLVQLIDEALTASRRSSGDG